MSDAPKPPTTSDLLATMIEEIRGLRADMRLRGGLPDTRIGKMPKTWAGPSYEGKQASECPGEFLLEYAGFLEWKADASRAKGEMKWVPQNERDALMCRRWAAVNRDLRVTREKAFRRPDPAPQVDGAAPQAAPAEAPKAKWTGGSANGWRKPQQGDVQS